MIIKSGDYVESLHGNVGVVKTERGEFDVLKRTKLTVTDLAVKINEIINYLNAEEC
jgi:hypothetical protein